MKLSKEQRIPVINSEKCVVCDLCVEICPVDAIVKDSVTICSRCIKYCISMEVPCKPVCYVIYGDICTSCGLCISECKNNAISWDNSAIKDNKIEE